MKIVWTMIFCYFSKGKKINHDTVRERLYGANSLNENHCETYVSDKVFMACHTNNGYRWQVKNGLVVGGKMFIYNQRQVLQQLGMDEEVDKPENLIGLLYRRHAEGFAGCLNGDFSVVLWDENKGCLLVSRDHIGHFPLYYINHAGATILSSSLEILLRFADKLSINPQWITDALYMDVSEKNLTVYMDIYRFVPASTYWVNQTNFTMKKHWQPMLLDSLPEQAVQGNLDVFREKFKQAVLNRMTGNINGFELSGGLDSSYITCTAMKYGTGGRFSFSHALPAEAEGKIKPFTDEKKHIEKIKQMYPGLGGHYIDIPSNDLITDIKNNILALKYLPQQQLQILSADLYHMASETKSETLFSGFGGDELLSSSGYYHIMEKMLNHNYFYIIRLAFQRKHNRLSYVRMLVSNMLKVWLYKAGLNNKLGTVQFHGLPLNEKALKEAGLYRKNLKSLPGAKGYYKQKMWGNVTMDHVTSRVENCQAIAEKYGFVYRYPMLDKELVEYYISLPPSWHYTAQWPRKLIREAAKGIMPDDLTKRRDKSGAVIPNVFYRIRMDEDIIRKFLDGYNRQNTVCKYINIDKVLELLDTYMVNSVSSTSRYPNRNLINYLTILVFYELFESGALFKE